MRKRSILRSRAFSSAVASRVGLAVVMVSCFSVSWGGGGMGGGDMVMRMEEVRETGGEKVLRGATYARRLGRPHSCIMEYRRPSPQDPLVDGSDDRLGDGVAASPACEM